MQSSVAKALNSGRPAPLPKSAGIDARLGTLTAMPADAIFTASPLSVPTTTELPRQVPKSYRSFGAMLAAQPAEARGGSVMVSSVAGTASSADGGFGVRAVARCGQGKGNQVIRG
jgi:hypothetical protein